MQKKTVKELETEVQFNISDLVSMDPSAEPDNYERKLKTIKNELAIISELKKFESEQRKLNLDSNRQQSDYSLRESQLGLEKEKFNADNNNKKAQIELDRDRFRFEKNSQESKLRIEEKNLELKERELSLKEKNDKKQLIITVAVAAVPAIVGLISNVIAIKHYNKLAIRALNMEYVDNCIPTRSYNDCMNSIKNFVSKK